MHLIDAYNNSSDLVKRAAFSKDVDDCYQKLIDKFGVDQDTLRLKA